MSSAVWPAREKGFVDNRGGASGLDRWRAVVKLGYQADRARLEPVYVQPLLPT